MQAAVLVSCRLNSVMYRCVLVACCADPLCDQSVLLLLTCFMINLSCVSAPVMVCGYGTTAPAPNATTRQLSRGCQTSHRYMRADERERARMLLARLGLCCTEHMMDPNYLIIYWLQFSPTIAPRHVEVRGDNLMAVCMCCEMCLPIAHLRASFEPFSSARGSFYSFYPYYSKVERQLLMKTEKFPRLMMRQHLEIMSDIAREQLGELALRASTSTF